VFIVFVGIVIWAWSGHNKARFEAAARIPLDDDDSVDTPEERHNG
jgi:cytochrome c oxidase cbb3-type subunit 4